MTDNTEQYRAMCDHEWVQEMWEPKQGDVFNDILKNVDFDFDDIDIVKWDHWKKPESKNGRKVIWLPRIEDWIHKLSYHPYNIDHTIHINKYDVYLEEVKVSFEGPILEQALCFAVGYIKGWEWRESKWVKR